MNSRNIRRTNIKDFLISTVFLGIDHNHNDEGEPILFETMIFGNEGWFTQDEYQTRSCTKEEAVKDHEKAVKIVIDYLRQKGSIGPEVSDEDVAFAYTFGSDD